MQQALRVPAFPEIPGLIARYSARGLTNEEMAKTNVWKDLTGNGHDITLHNFAWSGMSGVGGYHQASMYELFRANDTNRGKSEAINGNHGVKYTFLTEDYFLPTYCRSFADDYNNVSWKVKMESNREDLVIGIRFNGKSSDGTTITVKQYNLNNGQIVTIDKFTDEELSQIQYENSHESFTVLVSRDIHPNDWFTLTEIPEYPNALVSDGVDDYGICENFPILTKEKGYTVVAVRKWLDEENSGYTALVAKNTNSDGNNGAFQFEYIDRLGRNTRSYGGIMSLLQFNQSNFTYQTSVSYNGTVISPGASQDMSKLCLFRFATEYEGYYGQFALYDLLIYDRDLTEEEIGKLKRWLMYQQEHPEDTTSDWYGVEWYTDDSQSSVRRIGNVNLHKSLPIQSGMYRCILNDNGEEVYKLDPNDSTKKEDGTAAVLDGTDGQVMVRIPVFYAKFETQGYRRRVMLSSRSKSGFKKMGGCYISAYEATIDRTTSDTPKLASVVNTTANFRGGSNNSEWDNTYRSLLGMPATSTSLTNFRAYARNRNNGDTKWNCMDYTAYKAIYWLYIVEYADRNCQLDFNDALTSEGFRQGGLGAGVTNINRTKWSTFNSNHPFIKCGYTNSLGNKTGVVAFTMPDEYDAETPLTTYVPSYRGIENPFGHIWKWTDGINVRISPTTDNGGDNLSKVFVCSDPSKFNGTNYEGYSHVGNEARTEEYVKEVIFGEYGEIMPSVVGGNSTQFFCDYHYTDIPTTETLRGVLFGGYATSGVYAGFVYAYSSVTPSIMSTAFGSRLCYIPNNNNN